MRRQANLDWITDHLAVGGSFSPEHVEGLAREHGVRAVVDLRDEDRDDERLLRSHGITLLHLPTPDMCGVETAHLDAGVRFAADHLGRGERVLIHCQHGIGRSAVLALCVMVEDGFEPLAALERMKGRRALVSPSPGQFECWCGWLERYRGARRSSWDVPTFDQFRIIAYRHLMSAG